MCGDLRCLGRPLNRAVASHLLVGVLTTLLGVLKIKHIKCSGVPTRHPAPLRVHLMDKLKIGPHAVCAR